VCVSGSSGAAGLDFCSSFFFNFLVLAFLAFGSGFWRIVCPGQPARKPVNRALSLALSVCVLVCVCGEVSVCVWQLRCC